MKKLLLAITIAALLLLPGFVFAQGLLDARTRLEDVGGADGGKLGVTADLPTAISTVIKVALSLVGTIFLVLTIYAGILWMTAQGEEEKAKKARDIITMAVIGLVIVMSAYAITYFVTTKLQESTNFNNTVNNANQTGCCFKADYSVCAANTKFSDCAVNNNILWEAGPCAAACPQ